MILMNRIVGASSVTDNVGHMVPLGLAMLLLCGLILLFANRQRALWPVFIMFLLISQAQKLVIFSLDFNQMRIMAIIGLLRVLLKGELKNIKWHKIDYLVIAYALLVTFFHIIRDGESVIVFELGRLLDSVVPYIVFRALIQTHQDVISAIKKLIVLTTIASAFFLNEHLTGRNMFSIFGGVPEFTVIRDGRLRCQGAFVHPIIAGVCFATMAPLFVALWWHQYKTQAVVGVLAALLIIYACASSTPVFGVLSSILGAFFFFLREHMMAIRWSIYSMIVFLHMIMQAPVWSLIARVSATGSSDSWYRFMLIDVTIHFFSEWGFLGSSSSSYASWYNTFGPVDITDQFVKVALNGGLPGLILFIFTIALAFGAVGRMWRLAKQDKAKMYLAWALGCSLFAMVMSFVGVSIWGQMILIWSMVLAMIASMDNDYKDDIFSEENDSVSPQCADTFINRPWANKRT